MTTVRSTPGEGQAGQAACGSCRQRLRAHFRTHFRAPARSEPYFPWSSPLSGPLSLRHNPLVSSVFLLSVVEEIIGLRGAVALPALAGRLRPSGDRTGRMGRRA